MVHDFNLVGCDIRWKKRQIERVTLLEGMRTKIGGRTLRVDETKAKSTDLLESKIDEVKAGIPERRRKTRNGEVVLIFRKRWQNGSSWRKWVEIGDLERRISYWEDQDFRRSLYLRFNFYQNSLLLLCTALERNFSLFLPNSFFFIWVVVKAYSHPSIEESSLDHRMNFQTIFLGKFQEYLAYTCNSSISPIINQTPGLSLKLVNT